MGLPAVGFGAPQECQRRATLHPTSDRMSQAGSEAVFWHGVRMPPGLWWHSDSYSFQKEDWDRKPFCEREIERINSPFVYRTVLTYFDFRNPFGTGDGEELGAFHGTLSLFQNQAKSLLFLAKSVLHFIFPAKSLFFVCQISFTPEVIIPYPAKSVFQSFPVKSLLHFLFVSIFQNLVKSLFQNLVTSLFQNPATSLFQNLVTPLFLFGFTQMMVKPF